MGSEKKIADAESQHRLAKELQLFVIACKDGSLIGMGAMCQRFCEELDVPKHVSKLEL